MSSSVSVLRVDDSIVLSALEVSSRNAVLAEVPASVLPVSSLQSVNDSGILAFASRSVDMSSIFSIRITDDGNAVNDFASIRSQIEVSSRRNIGDIGLGRNHRGSSEGEGLSKRSRFVGSPVEVLVGVLARFPLVCSKVGKAVRVPFVDAFDSMSAFGVLANIDGARIPVFTLIDVEAFSVNAEIGSAAVAIVASNRSSNASNFGVASVDGARILVFALNGGVHASIDLVAPGVDALVVLEVSRTVSSSSVDALSVLANISNNAESLLTAVGIASNKILEAVGCLAKSLNQARLEEVVSFLGDVGHIDVVGFDRGKKLSDVLELVGDDVELVVSRLERLGEEDLVEFLSSESSVSLARVLGASGGDTLSSPSGIAAADVLSNASSVSVAPVARRAVQLARGEVVSRKAASLSESSAREPQIPSISKGLFVILTEENESVFRVLVESESSTRSRSRSSILEIVEFGPLSSRVNPNVVIVELISVKKRIRRFSSEKVELGVGSGADSESRSESSREGRFLRSNVSPFVGHRAELPEGVQESRGNVGVESSEDSETIICGENSSTSSRRRRDGDGKFNPLLSSNIVVPEIVQSVSRLVFDSSENEDFSSNSGASVSESSRGSLSQRSP